MSNISDPNNQSDQADPQPNKMSDKKPINLLSRLNFFYILKNKISSKRNQATVEKLKDKKTLPGFSQIKYLPKFLNLKEKIIIYLSLSIIIICLILVGFLFYKENFIDKPIAGGIYTEALIGSPQKINPLYAAANEVDRDLTSLIYAGLIKFDSGSNEQNIIPDLAQDWFVDDTETKYTFILRDNIEWPDEKPFTAEDVVFTYTAIQNSEYQSPLKSAWENITVQSLDDYTVQFTLPEKYSAFLENLNLGILPAHLWQDIRPENALLAELNLKPIGLGPYQFESFTKDKQGLIKSYTLSRNENYHLGTPYIKQVNFKFYPNFEMAVDALKSKNTDSISFLPQNLKEFLEPRKDLNYYSLSLPQYTAIFFNQNNNENLKISKFRQALLISIDKQKIVDTALAGQGRTIEGPILPGFPGYNSNMEKTGFNPEEAKKILSDLGWGLKKIEPTENTENNTTTEIVLPETTANGMSKYLFKNDQELAVSLTLANQPSSVAVGELIQKYWQAIGVKTNLNIIESNQIQSNIITPRKYEALLFGEILGLDPDPYPFWHSSQIGEKGLNLSNFENTEADSLIEKIRTETDPDKRTEYYLQFQNILIDQTPAIFLYNPNYTYPVASKIKGIDLTRIITPTDRLNSIEKWYTKTRKGLK